MTNDREMTDNEYDNIVKYKLCWCGSGLHRRELRDGYNIFLTYACEKCEKDKLSHFRPDIMERYDTDEQIKPDDDTSDNNYDEEWPSSGADKDEWKHQAEQWQRLKR